MQQVRGLAEAGCSVVVTGGKVGELYLHYANKHQLLVVRLMSKWDLRRLCKAISATPLPRIVSAWCSCTLLTIVACSKHVFVVVVNY